MPLDRLSRSILAQRDKFNRTKVTLPSMKTIDQLSGIKDGVIGETETARPQFDVVVPREFRVGRAADRQSVMIMLDPRSATQFAFALPREGAKALAKQIIELELEMLAEEAKNSQEPSVILPGLGKSVGSARIIPKHERLR